MKLDVWVVPDGKGVFAQGDQIDYAAGADTVAQCIDNFCLGLAMTGDEYMKAHGSVERLITKTTPEEGRVLCVHSAGLGSRDIKVGPEVICATFRGYSDGAVPLATK